VRCRYALLGKINKMSKKKLRRFIKRLAERKGISTEEALRIHLGEFDKNTYFSLHKKRNKGILRKKNLKEETIEQYFSNTTAGNP
jgi:hypothetical protein